MQIILNHHTAHNVSFCLAALLLPLLAACGGESPTFPDEDGKAALCLNIEQIGQTRSGIDLLTDHEKMHTVRIVVLHQDGTVEHNQHYRLEGAQTHKYIVLRVQPGEKKQIFLFANEESVEAVKGVAADGTTPSLPDFFLRYAAGTGGFAAEVNKLYFAPTYTAADGSFKPIPMSGSYEIEVPKSEPFEATFYVVRVATKFLVKFVNWRNTSVRVEYVRLDSHATENYLMAHVSESGQNATLLAAYDGSWVGWLKAMSEASSPSSPRGDGEQWLYDYALPLGEQSSTAYQSSPIDVPAYATDAGTAEHLFYLPESRHFDATTVTDGKQAYTISFYINEPDAGLFQYPMQGLNALFRNMEVVVTVEMRYHTINFSFDVVPYSSIPLAPTFGL